MFGIACSGGEGNEEKEQVPIIPIDGLDGPPDGLVTICDKDDLEKTGGIVTVIDAETAGMHDHDPSLTLTDVRVTFINDGGSNRGFFVQKSADCPGIQIDTNNANPTSGLTLPNGSTGGIGLGDKLTISVTGTSTFRGNEQVRDDGYRVTAWEDGSEADAFALATELSGKTSLEGLKGRLIKFTSNGMAGLFEADSIPGGGLNLLLSGESVSFPAFTSGLSADLFCASGMFTLTNGAIVVADDQDLQMRLFSNGQVKVIADGCPLPELAKSVIITRWTYGKGSGNASKQEFVEIANPTNSAVDVGGWTLRTEGNDANDCSGGDILYTFTSGDMIPSERYYLLTTQNYEGNKTGAVRLGSANPAPTGDAEMKAGIGSSDDIYLCDSDKTDGSAMEIDRGFDINNSSGRAAERKFRPDLDNYIDTADPMDARNDWLTSADANSYTILNSSFTDWMPPDS